MKIQVKDLTAGFHKNPILENVSFEISKGGIWFLLGPNGSGKSTLIKTLGGYITPEKGDILYDDVSLKNIPIKKRAKIIRMSRISGKRIRPRQPLFFFRFGGRLFRVSYLLSGTADVVRLPECPPD